MSAFGPVVVRKTIATSRQNVWRFLTDAAARESWWPNTQIEPEIGGKIFEKWSYEEDDHVYSRDAEGEVDVLVETQTIGFRWHDNLENNTTSVVILLRPDDEVMEHTVITVIESGFAGHEKTDELLQMAHDNWQELFAELASVVDAGELFADDSADADDSAEADADAPTDSEAEAVGAGVTVDADDEEAAESGDAEVAKSGDAEADEDADADEHLAADAERIEFEEVAADPNQAPLILPKPPVSDDESPQVVLEIIDDADTDADDGTYMTGEIHVNIVDGVPVAEVEEDIEIEEDGLSDWERLLQGDDED